MAGALLARGDTYPWGIHGRAGNTRNFSYFLPAVAVTIVTGFYSIFHSDATNFLMAFLPYQSFLLAVSVKRSAIKRKSQRLTALSLSQGKPLQGRCETVLGPHRDSFRCRCLGWRLSGG